jgi:hypothetical protein
MFWTKSARRPECSYSDEVQKQVAFGINYLTKLNSLDVSVFFTSDIFYKSGRIV